MGGGCISPPSNAIRKQPKDARIFGEQFIRSPETYIRPPPVGAPAASLFSPWLLLILQLYLSVLILYNLSAPLGPFFLETRAVLGGTFANFGQWVGMDAFFRHFAGPSTISSNLPRFPRPAGSRAASYSSPALLRAVNRFSQTLHGLRGPGRDLALLRRGATSKF